MTHDNENELYMCDYCGFQGTWVETDLIHGELLGCEKCGNTFCTKCFMEKHGQMDYMNMMQGYNLILCPDCWNREK